MRSSLLCIGLGVLASYPIVRYGFYLPTRVSELLFDFRTDDLTQSLERMERFGATIMGR